MGAKLPLTAKREIFCHELPKDFNMTRAAIAAGYSEKTAYSIGSELMKKPEIQVRIQEIVDKRLENADVTTQDIITELSRIGFSDIKEYLTVERGGEVVLKPFEDLQDGITRCIKTVEEKRVIKQGSDGAEVILSQNLKYSTHDKIKALELLGKYKKIFTDKTEVEHSGEMKITVVDNILK